MSSPLMLVDWTWNMREKIHKMAFTLGYNGGAIYLDKEGTGWGNEIKNSVVVTFSCRHLQGFQVELSPM